MSNIKVCFVGDDVRPPWNHASSILTKRLIECLSSAADIALATTTQEQYRTTADERETHLTESTGNRAMDALKLGIAAQKSSADIYHAVGTNALLFSPACRLFGAKGAIVRQIFTPYDRSDRMIRPIRRVVNRGFISAYFFTTPRIGGWRDELVASKRFVLRPPINCDLYKPLSRENSQILQSDGHDHSALYMGPLWKSRFPFRNVLQALKLLKAEGLDVHLTVIASATRTTTGQVEEVLATTRSLKLDHQVTVKRLDLLEPERVQAYNEADLVIFPYVGPEPEQLADPPFGILESMACGTTVLTTDVLSISEVVKERETGFLIPSSSADDLHRGIKRALGSGENNGLQENARGKIVQEFGYPSVRQEALNIYGRLLRQGAN